MITVRYFSKSGNTKQIAEGAGVQAVSTTEEPSLTQHSAEHKKTEGTNPRFT